MFDQGIDELLMQALSLNFCIFIDEITHSTNFPRWTLTLYTFHAFTRNSTRQL